LDNSDKPQGQTLWSAVKPIVEAEGTTKAIKPLELANNLFLIPGDIRLAEFEQELHQMWKECFQRKLKGFRGTAALSALINNIIQEYSIDFVFYDSGPNIGPLNRIILLDSDGFAIPAACDLFSLRAVKTLGHTLASWISDWDTISELAPTGVYLLPGRPRLLGYIPQRFRVYGGKPALQFSRFIPRLERAIQSDVVSVLRRIDPKLAPSTGAALKLGEIKEFGTLAAAAQVQGVPISQVSAGTTDQRDEANQAFGDLASRLQARATASVPK
jgi:hypothetical protein